MVIKSMGRAHDIAAIAVQHAEFEAFYREHLPFVRLYLVRRVEDPFLVADLTADVFVSAIRSAVTYRCEFGPPRAWLTGIARNIVADHWKSSARERTTIQRLQGREFLDEDSTDRIVQRIAAETQARSVLAAIAELPPNLRSVVELVAVDGLAVTEAAAVLNISPGNARVRYHRARRLLQNTPTLQPLEVTP